MAWMLIAGATAVGAQSRTVKPQQPWNGYRIFLSPAYHGATPGARGECARSGEDELRVERTMARRTAWQAAAGGPDSKGELRNLAARGYLVRIGYATFSENRASSNAWGADLHIPIHSNARGGRTSCATDARERTGTVVIYKSRGDGKGEGLSERMANRLGSVSPGERDHACHVASSCTAYDCLDELCNTRAIAAYAEAEYHDWTRGIDWLTKPGAWSWRIGWSVDSFLGYPRAPARPPDPEPEEDTLCIGPVCL
jgi:hypothetical protein